MKPVAIFRHARSEGPGYFATFLDDKSISWQLYAMDEGEPVPGDAQAFSGLVFMGGPMSVNDDLPWIAPVLSLIRQADAVGIPVLGHCLGGQLMARALGGAVSANPVKEIGWGEVTVAGNEAAQTWFAGIDHFLAFHWHGETFSVPPGATAVLSSEYCPNQAFSMGKHLAMQCHVEMTETMVREWCAIGAGEIASAASSPAVQSPALIEQNLPSRVSALNQVAAQLYSRWIEGLAR